MAGDVIVTVGLFSDAATTEQADVINASDRIRINLKGLGINLLLSKGKVFESRKK